MSGRKETKAAQVLRVAKGEVEEAQGVLAAAERILENAKAKLDAAQAMYNRLEKLLAPGKSQSPHRSSTAPVAAVPSSPRNRKAARGANTATDSNGAGDVAQALAVATGRSVEDARAALDGNGGDKKLAMLALTSE